MVVKSLTLLFSKRNVVLALLVVNTLFGVYRYLQKPIIPSVSQGDLLVNIVGQQKILGEPLFVSPEFAETVIPVPYLPIAYPLLSFLGKLNWDMLMALWPFVNILLVSVIGFLILLEFQRYFSPNTSNKIVVPVLFATLFLFKGTHGAILAGQVGFISILSLLLFFHFETKKPWLAYLFLMLASFKPNIAIAGYLYLLLDRKWHPLMKVSLLTLVVNLGISFLYLGPVEHLLTLVELARSLEDIAINRIDLAGASGRIDLAPALVPLGIVGGINKVVVLGGLLLALVTLFLKGRKYNSLENRALAVFVSLLFLYHRDQDSMLLVYASFGLIALHFQRLTHHLYLCIPFVIPVTFIALWGIGRFPQMRFAFDVIGGISAWALLIGFVLSVRAVNSRSQDQASLPASE